MAYSFSQSLLNNQPPLVVFIICLAAFGFTMVVLAYVVGEQELPNPDVELDWNKFFKKMADLFLCPATKALSWQTYHLSHTVLNSSSHIVDKTMSMSAVLSNAVDSALEQTFEPEFREISLKVKFHLQGYLTASRFNVKGSIKGNLLGLPSKYAHAVYNATFNFLLIGNSTCTTEKCKKLYSSCISMHLPADLLSRTKSPDTCSSMSIPSHDILQVTFSDAPMLSSDKLSTDCIALEYTPNEKLTEMLSNHDRSIVNLHLMHTSYFMFVMVMTLVCFSLIKGKCSQSKGYSFKKVPLDI